MRTTKPIRREITQLIIPMILESVLQLSAGIVTAAMVGRLSSGDIAAQGLCQRITDTLWCLFKGISIGVTVLAARAYGENNPRKLRLIKEQAYLTALPLSLFFSAILFFIPGPFLSFFTPETAVLAKGGEYMALAVFGLPFMVSMSLCTALFQAQGDTRTPMFVAVVMNVINLLLGYALIFGFAFLPRMEIKGAALALVIAQASGAALSFCLLKRKEKIQFTCEGQKTEAFPNERPAELRNRFFLNGTLIRGIYSIGLPAAMESVFWQFSAILLSKIILSYGNQAFSAYQLGIQAETLTEMPAVGFGVAATTLAARAIGQGDKDLHGQYVGGLIRLSATISFFTSALLIFFPHIFMRMMTDQTALQNIGIGYVFIMGFIQIPQNLSRIFNGAIRAAGYKKTPMYITGTGIWLFRLPLCALAVYVFHWPITSIWLIIALDQLLRFLLSSFFYRRSQKKGEQKL